MQLRFHNRLYPERVIRKAASDFNDIAEITVQAKGRHCLVAISAIKQPYDEKTVRGNFLNYVLMLSKSAC